MALELQDGVLPRRCARRTHRRRCGLGPGIGEAEELNPRHELNDSLPHLVVERMWHREQRSPVFDRLSHSLHDRGRSMTEEQGTEPELVVQILVPVRIA